MSALTARTGTIAFELVTTPVVDGLDRLRQEAQKVRRALEEAGLFDRINTLLVPQIIAEEGDRPVKYVDKIDPFHAKATLAEELPTDFILTQVTVFTPLQELRARLESMREAGVRRVVFVGVPRIFKQSDVVGPYPNQALDLFRDLVPSRGVVLIPTRPDEDQRFGQKLDAGANFGLSQLLFSDAMVGFLRALRDTPHRPEILLSFGYVPKVESRVGLIQWLLRDTTAGAEADMRAVARLAELSFAEKKTVLLELFKRIVGEATELGFPLGLHFEAPYGASPPALETFVEMLRVWDQIGAAANQAPATF